jgi:hypothetical protein
MTTVVPGGPDSGLMPEIETLAFWAKAEDANAVKTSNMTWIFATERLIMILQRPEYPGSRAELPTSMFRFDEHIAVLFTESANSPGNHDSDSYAETVADRRWIISQYGRIMQH